MHHAFNPPDFDPDFASPAEWAFMYRALGLQVVPAKSPIKGGEWKMPALVSWTEFQENLIPQATFDRWYGENGEHFRRDNMGILTGRCSRNVFVIDLDDQKGPEPQAWWLGLLAVHNNNMDPETVQQRTGGGGRQKLFRAPMDWVAPTNKTAIHIDIRGQGGFAMMPCSLHETGRHYTWEAGCAPWEIGIAAAPEWLLEAIETLVEQHGGAAGGRGRERTASGAEYDSFGNRKDLREEYMRDLIWAAVIGLRRECPIPPGTVERDWVWADYERNTRSRLLQEQDQFGNDASNAELLERENRGFSLFCNKWRRAIRKWDSKVREEAEKPRPSGDEYRNYSNSDEFQKERIDPGARRPVLIKWLDMSNWDNIPVPTRKWVIRDRVPLNQVGLFSGEGGTGKSIIELMKDVAHVVGGDWFGSLPEPGGAFYLGAEDEAEEIHIRLASIAKHYKTTFRNLVAGGLRVLPLLGKDSMLAVLGGRGNHIETTLLYKQLYEAAGDLKPKNISIDTLSRAFGGDEINRVQVYAFAMHMQALAKVAHGSVTILSHPSLSGMASGTGISGSTAWHGAFRFRQYLKGVRDIEDGNPTDDDLRELEFKKNQYGPRGRPIVLRYVDGLFLPVNGATDPERAVREARADGLFIRLLRRFCERCDRVTHLSASPNYYAPKVFVEEPEAKQQGFRKSELEDAMKRLMAEKKVLVEINGKETRRQSRLCLAPGT